jgi:hypothetical protein
MTASVETLIAEMRHVHRLHVQHLDQPLYLLVQTLVSTSSQRKYVHSIRSSTLLWNFCARKH